MSGGAASDTLVGRLRRNSLHVMAELNLLLDGTNGAPPISLSLPGRKARTAKCENRVGLLFPPPLQMEEVCMTLMISIVLGEAR
jgi:hypothetical protein